MSWFVLSIKKDQEATVQDKLNKIGVEVFNPSIKGVKYWSDRQKIVTTPLFKSHIFVRLEQKYRGIIFGVSGVNGYLFQDGKPVVVTNDEVNSIRQWLLEDDYDMVMLNKLITNKELSVENWFAQNNTNIKSINKKSVSQLLSKMDVVLRDKLKKVV